MRIFVFAHQYPLPYKPYYDTQFADLLRMGHDLTIFAGGRETRMVNEKVIRFHLNDRIRYFPTTLKKLPPHLPGLLADAVLHPRRLRRSISAVRAAGVRDAKRSLVHTARVRTLGPDRPDMCLVHGLGTMVQLPWLKQLYADTPLALYYHGGEVPSVAELEPGAVEYAFGVADAVFTNTTFSLDHAVGRGCPETKITILPVGFDLDDYQPDAERPYRTDGLLHVLSAGRMSEEKGFTYALEGIRLLVARGVHNVRYSMTGEGYLRPILEKFVADHKLEPYVHFLGTLSTDALIVEMGKADALLLSSVQVGNWVENQACAVQEAMLMRSVVITTRTGGVPESIPPEMQELVVPPNDAVAIADALERVARLPEVRLRALGTAGRQFVEDHYEVRRLNEALIARTTRAHEMRAR